MRAEMLSCVRSLEQQLAAQIRTTTCVQDLLFSELRAHQEAMRASARQQERREQALTQSHRDQLRQLRMDHWRNRYHASDIGDDISELARLNLADRISTLQFATGYEASPVWLPIRPRHLLIDQMEIAQMAID